MFCCSSRKSAPVDADFALFLVPGKVYPLKGKLCLVLLALGIRIPPLLALLKSTLGQGVREETSLHGELAGPWKTVEKGSRGMTVGQALSEGLACFIA